MEPQSKRKYKTVEEYLCDQPQKISDLLQKLRQAVKQVEPDAEEVISYNMPAFRFHGILLYYAAHKEHIGFYPGNASVIELFKNDLTNFQTSRGTIRFPVDMPLPLRVIKKIVRLRAKQNLEKSAIKTTRKK